MFHLNFHSHNYRLIQFLFCFCLNTLEFLCLQANFRPEPIYLGTIDKRLFGDTLPYLWDLLNLFFVAIKTQFSFFSFVLSSQFSQAYLLSLEQLSLD